MTNNKFDRLGFYERSNIVKTIIDKGFIMNKTPEQRLAELETLIEWLFDRQAQGLMSAHNVNYEVATIQYERLAILEQLARQKRRLQRASRVIGYVP